MTVRGTEGVKSLIRPNIAINQSPFKVNQGKGEGGGEKNPWKIASAIDYPFRRKHLP